MLQSDLHKVMLCNKHNLATTLSGRAITSLSKSKRPV